jgi:hypothetical protein
MKAPPDLVHQPNPPVLSAAVPWLSTVTIRSAAPAPATPGGQASAPSD